LHFQLRCIFNCVSFAMASSSKRGLDQAAVAAARSNDALSALCGGLEKAVVEDHADAAAALSAFRSECRSAADEAVQQSEQDFLTRVRYENPAMQKAPVTPPRRNRDMSSTPALDQLPWVPSWLQPDFTQEAPPSSAASSGEVKQEAPPSSAASSGEVKQEAPRAASNSDDDEDGDKRWRSNDWTSGGGWANEADGWSADWWSGGGWASDDKGYGRQGETWRAGTHRVDENGLPRGSRFGNRGGQKAKWWTMYFSASKAGRLEEFLASNPKPVTVRHTAEAVA
jgi:hypothetical protein